MEDQKVIDSNATRWFGLAGIVAIAFVLFLMKMDDYLTHSHREHTLGRTLAELRGAQSSLPSRVTDDRQLNSASPNAAE